MTLARLHRLGGSFGAAALLMLGCEVRNAGYGATGTDSTDTSGGASSSSSSSSSSSGGDPGTTAPECGPLPLRDVAQGVGGFVMDGESSGHDLGGSLSIAGDMNGDGRDDFIVAAKLADPNGHESGRSYVVFGKADTDPIRPADLAAGAGGFVVDGAAQSHRAGTSVAAAGDVDGDGLDDVVVGAPKAAPNDLYAAGRSYVVLGKPTTAPVQLAQLALGQGGFVMDGDYAESRSGSSVGGAGDVNGDGLDDVIVAAPFASPSGVDRSGRSYVVFGKANNTGVALADVALGVGGFVLDGERALDQSGQSVSGAGDVNGDGLADVVVGAPLADPNGAYSGRTYVVFGKTDTAPVALADVTGGVGGFAIDGAVEGDYSGWAVSGAGDVNGDGLADVVVSAPEADAGDPDVGRAYVVFGKAYTARVLLANVAQGIGGFVVDGEAWGSGSGRAVSGAGDVNGDGLADVIVGAPGVTATGAESGRTYVVYGKMTTDAVALADVAQGIGGFALDGEDFEHRSGTAVSGGGDVNGDGRPDVLVGAPLAAGQEEGRAYLVFGGDLSCAGR